MEFQLAKLTKLEQYKPQKCHKNATMHSVKHLERGQTGKSTHAVAIVTLLGSEAPSAAKNSVASSPSTSPSSR